MDYYAVIGKPILHSKSPIMQNAAFTESATDAFYFRIASKDVSHAFDGAKETGVKGLNVTSPYKEDVLRFCQSLDRDAQELNAANCLVFSGGKIKGHNTDVAGAKAAFSENGIDVKEKNVLILGSGGAAKSAVLAMKNGKANVTIANRTVEKAEAIAGQFECDFCPLGGTEFEKKLKGAQIIISAITAKGKIIPADLIPADCVVLDANYSKKSELVLAAEKKGCKVISGKEWLLYQGAGSFELFTSKKAPIQAMRNALEANVPVSKNIALSGFMASGKSTVAHDLSKMTGFALADLDAIIQHDTGMSVQEIFSNRGEKYFRELETAGLAKLLQSANNTIISCGGGTLLNPENARKIKSFAKVFCLWTNPSTIVSRVGTAIRRPLLAGGGKELTARKILGERKYSYLSTSDALISTTNINPGQTAEVILDEINSAG